MVDLDLVITLAIPLLVPVLAYLLNSRFQRQFEKGKTAYHEKLKAFTEMNDALSKVHSNILALKQYTAFDWKPETQDQSNLSFWSAVGFLALAKEDDRAVGGSAVPEMMEKYDEVLLDTSRSPEDKKAALEEWLGGSLMTLILLRLRLMAYYSDLFVRSHLAADILTDYDDVETAANNVNAFLLTDFLNWMERIGAEPPKDAKPELLVFGGIQRFESLHTQLRDAMREDLQKTL